MELGLWFAWVGCIPTAFVQHRAEACGQLAWTILRCSPSVKSLGKSRVNTLNASAGGSADFGMVHTVLELITPSGCKCICSPAIQASEELSSLGLATRVKLVLHFCIAQPTKYCAFCWEPCRAGHRDRQAILQGQEKSRWTS